MTILHYETFFVTAFWIFWTLGPKENLFSVREFETETSNLAPNGCLRVYTDQKFYARSNGMLKMIPSTL